MENKSYEKLYINRVPSSNTLWSHKIVIDLLSCRLTTYISIIRAPRKPTIDYLNTDQHFAGFLGSHTQEQSKDTDSRKSNLERLQISEDSTFAVTVAKKY